jgi:hypothetical protein
VRTRLVPLAFSLVALAGQAALPHPAAHAEPVPVRIVLEITDGGYRCAEGCETVDFSAGDWYPVIDVPLGAEVELVFIWAHEVLPFEEHVMVLDGYGLETEQLDPENRVATLHFIADQPGSHRLKCDLHCDRHDYMQRAELRVQRAGNGAVGALAHTPTTLALSAPASVISGFEPVDLHTALTDGGGAPIARAELSFYVDAEFAGVRDLVYIGSALTNEQGVATYRFQALTGDPEQRVVARFAGMGVYDRTEQELNLRVTGTPPARYQPQASRLEEIGGSLGARALGAAVLAVWAAFAYALLQVLRIARDGSEPPVGTPIGTPEPNTRRGPSHTGTLTRGGNPAKEEP